MSNEITVVFHGSNYDYHFITKELAKEIEGQCSEENTENYKTFSILAEK